MNKKKRGRVEISEDFYLNNETFLVFQYFLPCRINYDPLRKMYVLDGYCEAFEEIEEAEEIPRYEFTLTKIGNVNSVSEIKRIEE